MNENTHQLMQYWDHYITDGEEYAHYYVYAATQHDAELHMSNVGTSTLMGSTKLAAAQYQLDNFGITLNNTEYQEELNYLTQLLTEAENKGSCLYDHS